MSKASLLIALSLTFLGAPVLAADPATTGATATPKPTATHSMPALGGVRTFGVRAASTAIGGTLGMPIAAARLIWTNDIEQAKSIPYLGESPHKGLVWASRAIVIPTAGFVGLICAPVYSSVNGWKTSGDKPFSKETFSLGQLDESICPY